MTDENFFRRIIIIETQLWIADERKDFENALLIVLLVLLLLADLKLYLTSV